MITRLSGFFVTAMLSWGYGWGWVEVDIEAEVDLNLRLKWGWDEIESKFSWKWVEVELSWDKLTLNKGRNWAFIGAGLWFKIFWGLGSGSNCFGVYLYSAIIFIFFVSFNSDIWFWLNFGVVLTFWGTIGLFLGSMWGSKTVLGSTHVVEQLSFFMLP